MERKTIQFLKIFPLRGPNIWTYRPILEAWVDIGDLEDCPSNTLPGFVDRLCAWLPSLQEHRCSYGEPGGFIRRLHEGTWPAHILEHVTLELQNMAGVPGGFGKARETGVRGVYKVVVSAWSETVTRASLAEARDLVMAAIENRNFDVAAAVARLETMARGELLGPSTACIVAAAEEKGRGIPTIRLASNHLVQLGYGARQRRIWGAKTDRTGAIAEWISCDKDLCFSLLRACGVPVQARSRVESADEAWEEAQDTGLPVRVLPTRHAAGDAGVMVGTRAEMDAAFVENRGKSGAVILEQCPAGGIYRLLVVSGIMVAASRMDGGPHSSGTPHVSTDVTPLIHPETVHAACLAAKVVGLDIAGVDLVLPDPEQPISPTNGCITGVHSGPGLIAHSQPASGENRPVGRAIVDSMFTSGDDGRIPVVGISGSKGTTAVARLTAEFLRLGGKLTGLACADGLFFNRRKLRDSNCADWQNGRRILMNRTAEAAVIENPGDVILGEGLAYDRCQVGVVTGVDPELHYGRFHINTPEKVFQVMRSQVDVVLPGGAAVLNADDPTALEMASLCDGEVIFFSNTPESPVIANHLTAGGRAVVLREEDQIVLCTAAADIPIATAAGLPFVIEADAAARTTAVLAAVAAAWALDIPLHVIRTGVETFSYQAADEIPPASVDPESLILPE
jgi:cyanophycin synthetase